MGKLPVALQLYSVRDALEKDVSGVLRQVKEMGYDGVELAGMYGLTPEAFRAALDEVGLPAVSAHVSVHELSEGPAATVARYKTVGCEYIALPSLPPDMRPGAKDFDKTLALIHEVAALGKQSGITLLYHNHDFEFAVMPDGSFGLDYLYAAVPADSLQTELDTCWVRVAGQDPVAYIEKYANRCPIVHIKDYVKAGDTARVNPGEPASAFEFRPVGYGVQDVPAIANAALQGGAKWLVVEQDSSVGRPTVEAARLSRAYLQSLGF